MATRWPLCDIHEGEAVKKYGFPIGRASGEIRRGDWVHSHNLTTSLTTHASYRYEKAADCVTASTEGSFTGYLRENGEVGIRNEIWILPMVSCVNHTARLIAEQITTLPPHIDHLHALEQPFGCSQLGEDHATTVAILWDIALHPNCAGVLLLSLGCENNTMAEFLAGLGDYDRKRVRYLICQEHEDEIGRASVSSRSFLKAPRMIGAPCSPYPSFGWALSAAPPTAFPASRPTPWPGGSAIYW